MSFLDKSKYDIELYEKLLELSKSAVLKNQMLANNNETDISQHDGALFAECVRRIYKLSETDKTYIRDLMLLTGKRFYVQYKKVFNTPFDKDMVLIPKSSGCNLFDVATWQLKYDKFSIKSDMGFYDIPADNIKLDGDYWTDDSVVADYIRLNNIADVLAASVVYDSTFTLITKNDVVVDTSHDYYFKQMWFEITSSDDFHYYTAEEIYCDDDGSYRKLNDYFYDDKISQYKNLFLQVDDDSVLTKIHKNNNDYFFGYNVNTKSLRYLNRRFDAGESNYTVLPKNDYCEKCFGSYDKYRDTENNEVYRCNKCDITLTYDKYVNFENMYMVTYDDLIGDTYLKFETTIHEHLLNAVKTKTLDTSKLFLLDFVSNDNNAFKESNPYYIYLAKQGVDLSIARTVSDYDIVYLNNTIVEEEHMNLFKKSYNELRKYFLKNMYVRAYESWDKVANNNYHGLVSMILLLNSAVKTIDELYKTSSYDSSLFTRRQILNYFYSFGIYDFDDLPEKYQKDIVMNLHQLIKNKGSDKVIDIILGIIDNPNVTVYKYLLFKDYNRNELGNVEYPDIYTYDELNNKSISELRTILDRRSHEMSLDFSNEDFKNKISAIRNKITEILAATYNTENDILTATYNKSQAFKNIWDTITDKEMTERMFKNIRSQLFPIVQNLLNSLTETEMETFISEYFGNTQYFGNITNATSSGNKLSRDKFKIYLFDNMINFFSNTVWKFDVNTNERYFNDAITTADTNISTYINASATPTPYPGDAIITNLIEELVYTYYMTVRDINTIPEILAILQIDGVDNTFSYDYYNTLNDDSKIVYMDEIKTYYIRDMLKRDVDNESDMDRTSTSYSELYATYH